MSFLSLEFLALATVAVFFLWTARGALRTAGFFLLSSWFAFRFLGLPGSAVTLAFILLGYGAAKLCRRRPQATPFAVAALSILFVYMRGYDFLFTFLPENWKFELLATAGLSFLFFKILHVVIDAGGGAVSELRLSLFLNYCLNFTAFLMGPIQRYQDFVDQWTGRTPALPEGFESQLDAVNRVLRGLVKKYVLAAAISRFALHPGVDLASLRLVEIAAGTYLFYLLLYLDFSGYCDIVIGVGALMGIRPPENFWFPFLSPNIAQFWLRVHRSLTTWLTDYVFNPTYARSLRSKLLGPHPLLALSVSLMLTMVVAGLWHGTTFSFFLFGAVHGIYLIVFRLYEHVMIRRIGRKGLRSFRATLFSRVLGTFLTFNVSSLAYLFFVADTDSLLALAGRILG